MVAMTDDNFKETHQQLVIPKYQREYKWDVGRVEDFINDIKNQEKFIGNILLDEIDGDTGGHYEVTDGQQRLTTILLALMAIHNIYGENMPPSVQEQEIIRGKINFQIQDQSLFLQNESLGKFVNLNGNKLELDIENDIYFQDAKFKEAYSIIFEVLKKDITGLRSFKAKLYSSKLLVLINESSNYSTEEMFLDINYKLQPLSSTDIFKGYCFKNIDNTYHSSLKEKWKDIVLLGKNFKKIEYDNLGEFLYYYLLSHQSSAKKITADLTLWGKRVHYLEGKDTDQTQAILDDIITYGNNVIEFYNSLSDMNYRFEDLFADTQTFSVQNEREKFIKMSLGIMQSPVLIHKLPFLFLINCLKKDIALKASFNKSAIKVIITHAYIYYALFMADEAKKNNDRLDYTISSSLLDNVENKATAVSSAYKSLKRVACDSFRMQANFSKEALFAASSVADFYILSQNALSNVYDFEIYNREHLIVQNSDVVVWKVEGGIDIRLFETLPRGSVLKKQLSGYKKKTINYIVLKTEFNQNLGSLDIVKKIVKIKEYFGGAVPKIIRVYIEHIETLNSYLQLVEAKEQNLSQSDIQTKYINFYREYFDAEKENELLRKITVAVKSSVINQS